MAMVKICGLSTLKTVEASIAAGADMIGFVFFERSPRHVSNDRASALRSAINGQAKVVALVVDADDERLKAIAGAVQPDFIQAHGSETPERIAAITRLTGVPVIKAIAVRAADDIAAASAYKDVAALTLYDAKAPRSLANALPGGNGVSFDWKLLATAQKAPFMLSGGLNPENVAEAIAITKAPMVDVSSGVETSPGVKDITLIVKFIEAAKAAR